MKNNYTAILLLLLFIVFPLQAENETVHNLSLILHTLSNKNDTIEDAVYTANLLWEPEIYGYLEQGEIIFKPALLFPVERGGKSTVEIKELKVSFYPKGNLEFDAGRYVHNSSFAAFFSKTAFFRAIDYQELLKGKFDSAAIPSWLVEGSIYIDDWYIRVGVEPFREDLPFFDPDSIWFPNLGFKETIASPFAPDGEIALEEIRLVEPEPRSSWDRFAEDIGRSLEMGGRIGLCDFLMIIYSGRDTVPLYSAEIVLKNLVEDYRVDLHPIEERVTAFGAALRTAIGPVVIYGESAFYLDKPFIKETFYSTVAGFETESYKSEYWGTTIGGRWEWWKANLLVSAEFTNGYIINEAPRTVMPFFQRMALSSLIWMPFDRQIIFSLAGVVAMEDNSVAANCSVEYAPGEGRISVKLSTPLFFGTPDSSFGQYSEILYPTLSSSISF